jgi:NhaP-type Na+/H+ or K+/H+ antiporter
MIKSIRDYRFYGLAIIDFFVTLLFAILLHYFMWNYSIHHIQNRTYFQFIFSLFFIFITFIGFGFILHWIFGIKSRLSFILGI